MKNHPSRRLRFENLESRSLLAGNVLVSVSEGVLHITGDDEGNRFRIEQLEADNTGGAWTGARYLISQPWVPQGEEPTTFNGESSVVVEGVTSGLEMNLAGGRDVVYVRGAKGAGSQAGISGGVSVDMGAGDDVLNFPLRNFATTTVQMGTGSDYLEMKARVHALNVLGDPDFTPGDPIGHDQFDFRVKAGGSISIDTRSGDDVVRFREINTLSSRATIEVKTGNGGDRVTGATIGTLLASLRIETGRGEDSISLEDLNVTGNVTVNSGEDRDGITIEFVSISNKLGVWAGRGDDGVRIVTDVTSTQASLGGGDGSDTLEIGSDRGVELGDAEITGFETQRDI